MKLRLQINCECPCGCNEVACTRQGQFVLTRQTHSEVERVIEKALAQLREFIAHVSSKAGHRDNDVPLNFLCRACAGHAVEKRREVLQ